MKVFIYDKRFSNLHKILNNVREVTETDKYICFTFADTSTYEVEKKTFKTTIYQN